MSREPSPDPVSKQSGERGVQESSPGRDTPGVVIASVQSVSQEEWAGPLPPPSALAAFAKVDPSFPQRILQLTEREQQHRHEFERQSMQAQLDLSREDSRMKRRGQVFAFASVVLGMVVAVVSAYLSQPTIGVSIGVAALSMPTILAFMGQSRRETGSEHNDPSRDRESERQ